MEMVDISSENWFYFFGSSREGGSDPNGSFKGLSGRAFETCVLFAGGRWYKLTNVFVPELALCLGQFFFLKNWIVGRNQSEIKSKDECFSDPGHASGDWMLDICPFNRF